MPANNNFLAALLANAQNPAPATPKKRKRGGLAGIWDRNKGAIGSIAGAGLATLIPGGAAIAPYIGGALGGAAARGRLDERAIGDAFMGAGGVSAAKGISGMLGRRAASRAVQSAVPLPASGAGMQVIGGGEATNAALSTQIPASRGMMAGLGRVGNFIEKNPNAAGMAFQGAASALGGGAERRMRQQEFELLRERDEDERRRRATTAALLLPLYQQQMGRFNP